MEASTTTQKIYFKKAPSAEECKASKGPTAISFDNSEKGEMYDDEAKILAVDRGR